MEKQNFNIIFVSDPDKEKLVAEISFEGKFGVMLTHEAPDVFELEFPGINLDENQVTRKIPLEDFLEAIDTAKDELESGQITETPRDGTITK